MDLTKGPGGREAGVAMIYKLMERCNRRPREVLSIIGSDPAEIT
jgi:hypothetical protein